MSIASNDMKSRWQCFIIYNKNPSNVIKLSKSWVVFGYGTCFKFLMQLYD